MQRTRITTLHFAGGPWDGRVVSSIVTPRWFDIGDGRYELTVLALTQSGEACSYTWRSDAATDRA